MEARVTYAHIAALFRNLAPQVGCQLYEVSYFDYRAAFALSSSKLPLRLKESNCYTVRNLVYTDLSSLKLSRKTFVQIQEFLAPKNLAFGLLKATNRKAIQHLCEDNEEDDDIGGFLNPDRLNDLETLSRSMVSAKWPVGVVLYDPEQLSVPLTDFFDNRSVKKKLKENGDMTVADFVKLKKEELMVFPLSDQNLRLLMSRLAKKHIYWGMKIS